MKRRLVCLLAVVMACAFLFAACSSDSSTSSESASSEASTSAEATEEASASAEATEEASESAEASEEASSDTSSDNSDMLIEVVAKGFQHQFWQVVKEGAEAAGKEYGVTVNFQGPASESNISEQVDMLNAALAKDPKAIVLAALDTESVTSQLDEAVQKDIPVIGFDSGVPDAPAGSIKATASTDNEAAAALAADEMMKDTDFADKVKNATADSPVVIGVLSQDATSASIIGRTTGFINGMKAVLSENGHAGDVAVQGHQMYEEEASEGPAVIIQVTVPATPDASDMKNGADSLLNTSGIAGIFCSNEGASVGLLNATNDGSDLNKDSGKYKDIVVAGFDAGSTQKQAVRDGNFLGAVTQDPYHIGYDGVELAVKAAKGETVEDMDTGAVWYNAANMDEEDIAKLLYD